MKEPEDRTGQAWEPIYDESEEITWETDYCVRIFVGPPQKELKYDEWYHPVLHTATGEIHMFWQGPSYSNWMGSWRRIF